jgi:ribosomal protein L16/L10AE
MQKWGGSNILYLSKEGLEKIAEKVNTFWKDVFFKFIRVETGKGGVSGWSARLEPAHMVKSLDKNRW